MKEPFNNPPRTINQSHRTGQTMFQPLNQSTMTQNTILTILEMVHCSMQIFAVFAVNPKLIYQSYHLAKHKGAQHQTISPLIMPWPFSFFLIHNLTHLLTFLFSHLFTFLYFLICWPTNQLINSANQSSSFIIHSLFFSCDLYSCLLTHFLT